MGVGGAGGGGGDGEERQPSCSLWYEIFALMRCITQPLPTERRPPR